MWLRFLFHSVERDFLDGDVAWNLLEDLIKKRFLGCHFRKVDYLNSLGCSIKFGALGDNLEIQVED